jgi:GxxExxY protein
MTENEIAKEIVDSAFRIHKTLGPGLLESVYQAVLARHLTEKGFSIQSQSPVSITFENMLFEDAFRADIIVNRMVIVELKSKDAVAPVDKKQLLTYLRLTKLKLGLLINFGENLIKDGITRIANNMDD